MLVEASLVDGLHFIGAIDTQFRGTDTYDGSVFPMSIKQRAILTAIISSPEDPYRRDGA